MILTKKIKKYIKQHSLDEYPNECCGIIVQKTKEDTPCAHRAKNIATNKRKNFEIDAKTYLKASSEGKITGYYHSHPNENKAFSVMDKAVSAAHGLPLVMYFLKQNKFFIYNHERIFSNS